MAVSRRHLALFAKMCLGGAVLSYVLRSGMIDFGALGPVLGDPRHIFVSAILFGGLAGIMAVRWHGLAHAQGLRIPLRQVWNITMIGHFFGTFLPSSLGMDVVRGWYLAGEEPSRKARTVFVLIVDRAVGLLGMLSYVAVASLFSIHAITARPAVARGAYAIWGLAASAMVVAGAYFGSRPRIAGEGRLAKVTEAFFTYREKPLVLARAFLLSLFSTGFTIALYAYLGHALGITLSPSLYLLVIPLGVIFSAIPLLPVGIGVGQVAFFELFRLFGVVKPEQGATLCTLVQAYSIGFNLVGLFFYLNFRRGVQR